MVVLIDTNVALDFLTMRQPYYEEARDVIRICAGNKIEGYIAFHSAPNIFYILRKSYSETDRRAILKKLCGVLRGGFGGLYCYEEHRRFQELSC